MITIERSLPNTDKNPNLLRLSKLKQILFEMNKKSQILKFRIIQKQKENKSKNFKKKRS